VSKTVRIVYRQMPDVEPYVAAVQAVGLTPRLESIRPGVAIGDCAGLLLTGGTDVNPALYGAVAAPETEEPDDERDHVESMLLNEAMERDLPVFAICRGMQLLNVHLGGSLIQHLPGAARHVRRTPNRAQPAHSVTIEPATMLASIAGAPRWDVNSRHHQAVDRLGEGLRIDAVDSDDGTIEAVEYPTRRYVLAVQWHPENQMLEDPGQRKLFESFANAL
jgi:gamma-glutamyl-gamma-aminobutyrate hydrolase PuuD